MWRQRIQRADRDTELDSVVGAAMRAYSPGRLPDDLVEARSTRYAEIAAADALSQQIYAAHPGARPGIAAGHINMDPHTNTVIERDTVRMMLDDCISQATSEETLTRIRRAAQASGYWNALLEERADQRSADLHPRGPSGTPEQDVEDVSTSAIADTAAVLRIYLGMGWKVFPLWWPDGNRCACPNGRLPETHKDYCGLRSDGTISGSPAKHPITRNGVKDATADPGTVASWWTRYPLANVGLPAGDNGLAVLDEDPRHGGSDSLRKLRKYLAGRGRAIPETLTGVTGSGGRHFVFTQPEGGVKNVANAFGDDMPGLDTRGRGGYIVAPPSTHICGGTYEWVDLIAYLAPWPTTLTRLMNPPKPKPQAVPAGATGSPPRDRYAAKALAEEVADVRATKEPGRNNRLNLAAFNLGQLVASGLLDESLVRRELYNAAIACGLGERDSANTIDSGLNNGKAKPRARVAA